MVYRQEDDGQGCTEQDHAHNRPEKDDRGKGQDDHEDKRDLVVAVHVHVRLPIVRGPELKGYVCSGGKKER